MIRRRANICSSRYNDAHGNWLRMYKYVIQGLQEKGYDIHVSPLMELGYDEFPEIPRGLDDECPDRDLFVYNHTYKNDLVQRELYRTDKSIYLKPTGPTPDHFTIDKVGYGCHLSITYTKPDFENYNHEEFFETKANKWVKERKNKWSEHKSLNSTDLKIPVPAHHTLVLGQMPNDETVYNFSFGNHWDKIVRVVSELQKAHYPSFPIVVKLHPEYRKHLKQDGREWLEKREKVRDQINKWRSEDITVIDDFTSLHDVLPHSRVVILENSTSGIECLLHKVPIISFGYPEYHWITKDLRHMVLLNEYVEDLSWYDENKASSFVAWYCEQFMCYDQQSTNRRLQQLLGD